MMRVAHEQHTGGKALFIGEPAHDRAQHRIVGEANAETDQTAVGKVQKPQAVRRDTGTKKMKAHGCTDENGNAGREAAGDKAAA